MNKLLLLLIFFTCNGLSQKNDYVWLLGYGYSLHPNDTFGISVLDFNTPSLNPRIYFNKDMDYDFHGTNVCMSDKNGKFIFATDGNTIVGNDNKLFKNGKSIDPDDNLHSELEPQSCLVLSTYEENKFLLINYRIEVVGLSIAVVQAYHSTIVLTDVNGNGEVINPKITFSEDTLTLSKLVSTRHANGMDWWLPIPGYNNNLMYTYLCHDTEISLIHKQVLDSVIYNGYGQAAISPDGSYYANISSVSNDEGTYLYLYQFDRCTGLFTFLNQWHINNSLYEVGVSFSPDSKILYFNFWPYAFQIDLTSHNKKIDTLAKNDYFIEDIGGGFRRYNPFAFLQMGPDNRLYCVPTTESRNMHVINNPNILGKNADLRQHHITLPSLHMTLPMHPNFRLGPIDGSSCDTLGIDNIPVAEFRYDQDTTQYLKLNFTDLSSYEPNEWYWDFGDPNSSDPTSRDTSPIHIFSTTGVYKVCLKVKNANGKDSICKDLNLGTTTTKETDKNIPIVSIYPNPVKDRFNLIINDYLPCDAFLVISDQMGKEIYKSKVYHGWNVVDVSSFSNGVYFYTCYDKSIELGNGKLVKMN